MARGRGVVAAATSVLFFLGLFCKFCPRGESAARPTGLRGEGPGHASNAFQNSGKLRATCKEPNAALVNAMADHHQRAGRRLAARVGSPEINCDEMKAQLEKLTSSFNELKENKENKTSLWMFDVLNQPKLIKFMWFESKNVFIAILKVEDLLAWAKTIKLDELIIDKNTSPHLEILFALAGVKEKDNNFDWKLHRCDSELTLYIKKPEKWERVEKANVNAFKDANSFLHSIGITRDADGYKIGPQPDELDNCTEQLVWYTNDKNRAKRILDKQRRTYYTAEPNENLEHPPKEEKTFASSAAYFLSQYNGPDTDPPVEMEVHVLRDKGKPTGFRISHMLWPDYEPFVSGVNLHITQIDALSSKPKEMEIFRGFVSKAIDKNNWPWHALRSDYPSFLSSKEGEKFLFDFRRQHIGNNFDQNKIVKAADFDEFMRNLKEPAANPNFLDADIRVSVYTIIETLRFDKANCGPVFVPFDSLRYQMTEKPNFLPLLLKSFLIITETRQPIFFDSTYLPVLMVGDRLSECSILKHDFFKLPPSTNSDNRPVDDHGIRQIMLAKIYARLVQLFPDEEISAKRLSDGRPRFSFPNRKKQLDIYEISQLLNIIHGPEAKSNIEGKLVNDKSHKDDAHLQKKTDSFQKKPTVDKKYSEENAEGSSDEPEDSSQFDDPQSTHSQRGLPMPVLGISKDLTAANDQIKPPIARKAPFLLGEPRESNTSSPPAICFTKYPENDSKGDGTIGATSRAEPVSSQLEAPKKQNNLLPQPTYYTQRFEPALTPDKFNDADARVEIVSSQLDNSKDPKAYPSPAVVPPSLRNSDPASSADGIGDALSFEKPQVENKRKPQAPASELKLQDNKQTLPLLRYLGSDIAKGVDGSDATNLSQVSQDKNQTPYQEPSPPPIETTLDYDQVLTVDSTSSESEEEKPSSAGNFCPKSKTNIAGKSRPKSQTNSPLNQPLNASSVEEQANGVFQTLPPLSGEAPPHTGDATAASQTIAGANGLEPSCQASPPRAADAPLNIQGKKALVSSAVCMQNEKNPLETAT
eukprot:GHVT01031463.1.p1 GENE.GHVT01031463.1~~GHVT01031463.1.p1  ORF type:complete len:1039 (-),score=130.42 GHVT01031463.1:792-3908(-)